MCHTFSTRRKRCCSSSPLRQRSYPYWFYAMKFSLMNDDQQQLLPMASNGHQKTSASVCSMSMAVASLETEMKNVLSFLVGNRVWFVNLRERTRVTDAFTTLIKELYKPQSKYTHCAHVSTFHGSEKRTSSI